MLGTILVKCLRSVWIAPSDNERRFFAVIALATFGIFLNGITSVVFSSNVFAYVYFLCAGAAMSAVQLLRPAHGASG
jgi:hypothetical protein